MSSSRPRVWVSKPLFDDIVDRLREHCDVEAESEDHPWTAEDTGRRLSDKHGALLGVSDPVNAASIALAPSLRAIANVAVGTDNLDLAALTARGIVATNTPDVLTETVADFAWALMLATARRVGEAERFVRAGRWLGWSYTRLLGGDVHGRTLGILGMGRIGQAIARRAAGFRMPVVYHNRSRLDAALERECAAAYVNRDELLQRADFLVLVLPLTAQTRHAIGAAELARMKATSVLVNIARGGVVDDTALVAALRERRIAGAGLDVFENEPALDPAFLALDNVVLAPHLASASVDTRRAMTAVAVDNLLAALGFGPQAGTPPNVVNPDALKNHLLPGAIRVNPVSSPIPQSDRTRMSKKSSYKVAMAGATGAVGEALLAILKERKFPVGELVPLASERSAGDKVEFGNRSVTVKNLADYDFAGVDIAFFSAGGSVSRAHAPRAAAAGAVVIDNTSEFRYQDDIPLVVSEVNPHAIARYTNRGVIANPNCSTMQMLVALAPIHRAVGITRINVATYQSVSGAGRSGLEELGRQTAALLNFQDYPPAKFSKQIAFNVIPHIDEFQANGYTKEEMKMVWETRKILEDESIVVNPTAVRVPVFYGHSEAVHVETRDKITAEQARTLLESAPGVVLVDERKTGGYPTPVSEAAGKDPVFVGRIREDISHPRGLNLWVVSDNIRKGAALNAVQVGEILAKTYL